MNPKKPARQLNGVLLLNKPLGLSSNQALQRCKRIFGAKKAGHTGSLDPLATGLLPICFGEATKFSQYLLDADKIYQVEIQLGVTTSTGDAEGEILSQQTVPNFSVAEILLVLQSFLGESLQIPPMYSALKKDGRPLYELARLGLEVERPARKIEIYGLVLEALEQHSLILLVHCSKGTYIRTLAEDIGKKLTCGAFVKKLHRLSTGQYHQKTQFELAQLETMTDLEILDKVLLPLDSLVQNITKLSVNQADYLAFYQGKILEFPELSEAMLYALYLDDVFFGIAEKTQANCLHAKRLLSQNPR